MWWHHRPNAKQQLPGAVTIFWALIASFRPWNSGRELRRMSYGNSSPLSFSSSTPTTTPRIRFHSTMGSTVLERDPSRTGLIYTADASGIGQPLGLINVLGVHFYQLPGYLMLFILFKMAWFNYYRYGIYLPRFFFSESIYEFLKYLKNECKLNYLDMFLNYIKIPKKESWFRK